MYCKHWVCGTCARRRAPGRKKRSTLPYRPKRFNQLVGIDTKDVTDANGTIFKVYYAPYRRAMNAQAEPADKDIAYYTRGANAYEIFDGRYSPMMLEHESEEIQSPMARAGQALPAELMQLKL